MWLAQTVAAARPGSSLFADHPKCLLAIDPYAVDTVSPAVGAAYAAWMHQIYLAWDRQPSTQSWIQRHALLRGAGFDRIGWRLLRSLRRDIPVLMMLPGGLPHNARILYAAREFAQRVPRAHPSYPKREAERRLMEIVKDPADGIRPTERGELPPPTVGRILSLFAEWGLDEAAAAAALDVFRQEFARDVPYRERLHRVLAGRLAKRGKPLLIVGVAHRTAEPWVDVSAPWSVCRSSDGTLEWSGGEAPETLRDATSFAKRFSAFFAGI